jgi:hypothetical protein
VADDGGRTGNCRSVERSVNPGRPATPGRSVGPAGRSLRAAGHKDAHRGGGLPRRRCSILAMVSLAAKDRPSLSPPPRAFVPLHRWASGSSFSRRPIRTQGRRSRPGMPSVPNHPRQTISDPRVRGGHRRVMTNRPYDRVHRPLRGWLTPASPDAPAAGARVPATDQDAAGHPRCVRGPAAPGRTVHSPW